MLTLYLLRHAKSSWGDTGLSDHDRPLSARGERDAPRMGAYLAAHFTLPSLIVCSTAKRARETLRLAGPAFGVDEAAVEFESGIYEVPPSRLLSRIRALSDEANVVLVVGHNPGMQGAALELTGRGDRAMIRNVAIKFSTAALAVLEFDVDHWNEVRSGSGHLTAYVRPKDLET
jgi:phosphohistidine phosphatase